MSDMEEDWLRLAEAMVFASATPVGARALGQILPEEADAEAVLTALVARYQGRGVELVFVAGGAQFRTASDLAPALRKVVEIPRRLPRVAMETLAVIAYHQPVTRPEVEEIRGASLSQQTLDALLEAALIAPRGRRETPGRPTLWGTTPAFLAQFGLSALSDLPRRADLLVEPPSPQIEPAAAAESMPAEGEVVDEGAAEEVSAEEAASESVRAEDGPATDGPAENGPPADTSASEASAEAVPAVDIPAEDAPADSVQAGAVRPESVSPEDTNTPPEPPAERKADPQP